jgi:PKD repeat protein
VRRVAVALITVAFLAGTVTLAGATNWGGSGGYDHDASTIQYKKKKLCALILWIYNHHHDGYKSTSTVKTDYGWYTLYWLVKWCLSDEDKLVANKAPTAAITVSPNPVRKYRTATFYGTGSKDTDGTIKKYEWDLDNNGTFEVSGTSSSATKTFTSTGSRTVKLRVTDDAGAISPVASLTFSVTY